MLDLFPDFVQRFGFDPEHPTVTIRVLLNGSGLEISCVPEIQKEYLLAVFDGVPASARQLRPNVSYEFRIDEYQVLSVLADGEPDDGVPAGLVEPIVAFLEQVYPVLEEELIQAPERFELLSGQVAAESGKDLQYRAATGAFHQIRPGGNPIVSAEEAEAIKHEGGIVIASDEAGTPFFPFHLELMVEAARRIHARIERAQAIRLVRQLREGASRIEAAFGIGPDETEGIDVPDVLQFYPDANDPEEDAEDEALSAADEDGLCN